MKLADYLEANGIKRGDFARQIDVSGGWITSLCDGSGWPSRDVAEKIATATNGAVTPDDFLEPKPADVSQKHPEGAPA